MKFSIPFLGALAALSFFAGGEARADNMASIAIAPATGAVTLTQRWTIGGNLGGFRHMAQDLSLGGGANEFYSLKSTAIPSGGDITAFSIYIAASGAKTDHTDIGSKLTPNSYSALASADPDLGFGSVQLYFIHHKTDGDYFSHLVPSSGTASAVTDLKPMSGPGGPVTGGASGYFGLAFAAANLGYGLNTFYYLRTDPVTHTTKFGTMVPALAGASADKFDLGVTGHNALEFSSIDVGYGVNKMYFERLDPITGFTILGTLDPTSGKAADIANLGSVYTTLAFVPGDVGFGSGQFYTTGAVNPTWQSVSFAAIADRLIGAGSFTVAPSASSTLPIVLTVVAGSTGSASISGPIAGVYTVTPTAPGIITLQATQAGQAGLFEFNMLRQSFTATGVATLAITAQPTSHSAVSGTTTTFSVTATGTTTLSYQWRKAGVNIPVSNPSATTATLSLANVQASDTATYDVAITNASGTILSDPVTLTVTTGPIPVITNSPLSSANTVGAFFSFTIAGTNTPTSYSASPLPPGITLNAVTGVLSGTLTTVGSTSVLLGATNASGTGNATLNITVAAASTAPVITNNPTAPAGAIGTPFSFTIVASGSPTSYTASPLPPGLSLNAATGVISGTPTTAGTTVVSLSATNASGTTTSTLTITVGSAASAPSITNNPGTASGAMGTPFSFIPNATGATSFSATGLPAGLTLNTATGAITGTPTQAGTSVIVLSATNATGTSSVTFTLTIAGPATVPVITSPATAPGTAGVPIVTYVIAATGTPTSYTATGLPPGLTLNPATGAITGTPTAPGTYPVTVTATNSAGTTSATVVITIGAAGAAPIFTSPATAPGVAGAPFVTYQIGATGQPTSYTATGLPAGLTLNPVTGAISGTPTVTGTFPVTITATNASGTTSTTLTITIAATFSSRIVNFSARALSGPGDQTLIMGFVVQGDNKNLLVRGIGPGLAPYGVVNVLADPFLTLFGTGGALATNDDWQSTNGPLIATTATRVGAFALPTGSKDAALLFSFNNGAHTTSMLRPNSATGVALTEIYDTDPTATSRLINVSARMNVTTGEGTLIAGLVIAGNAPTTVLIRGIGPTLTSFGVTGALADPTISVFSGTTLVATNDNWETGSAGPAPIIAASARVGAFALPAGSKDAVLLLTLQPGAYTVQVTGVANTTGVALVEVYDAN